MRVTIVTYRQPILLSGFVPSKVIFCRRQPESRVLNLIISNIASYIVWKAILTQSHADFKIRRGSLVNRTAGIHSSLKMSINVSKKQFCLIQPHCDSRIQGQNLVERAAGTRSSLA